MDKICIIIYSLFLRAFNALTILDFCISIKLKYLCEYDTNEVVLECFMLTKLIIAAVLNTQQYILVQNQYISNAWGDIISDFIHHFWQTTFTYTSK